MKRIGLLTGLLLLAVSTFAQSKVLFESTVQPPKFIGPKNFQLTLDEEVSPICSYLKSQLKAENNYDEGVAIVLFTINANGTLSNFNIENSVSPSTDRYVINCIKKTSGMWQPGSVNGEAVEMQKTLVINFIDPENGSPEEIAQQNLESGIKKYNAAILTKDNIWLAEEVAEKRANRKLKSALNFMELARRYQPTEPSIIFWQACVYEKIGDEINKKEKLNEFMDMVNSNFHAQRETVDIILR